MLEIESTFAMDGTATVVGLDRVAYKGEGLCACDFYGEACAGD